MISGVYAGEATRFAGSGAQAGRASPVHQLGLRPKLALALFWVAVCQRGVSSSSFLGAALSLLAHLKNAWGLTAWPGVQATPWIFFIWSER